MDERLRFLLYGTYDGFSRSTFGDDNILLVLDNGDRAEVPRHFVKNASDFIEKNKIKLKDVITRIKGLNIGTQKVWLNEILNELGSDYGALKYKDGYEQGKLYGEWVGQQLKNADKIRQELNKPIVPQFVADWIEVCKENLAIGLYTAMDPNFMKQNNQSADLMLWIKKSSNQEIFARAWIFGYTVKEKRYTVKIKAILGQYLERYYLNNEELTPQFKRTQPTGRDELPTFTRKELEDANFGWVFDCPGIEIEEVEE